MGETELVRLPGEESPEDNSQRGEILRQIEADIADCKLCKLSAGRNKLVFGVGDPNAEIMFIGEAPGADEDRIGKPFVGRAGQLLDKIFTAMGLSRASGIYIANILKCRPPNNRDPEADEVEMCMPVLMRQIEAIAPKVICCLGRVAAQNLLGTDATLGNLRGKVHSFATGDGEVPVVVTYHPAYLLRNSAGKVPVWEDMKTLMRIADLELPREG